MPLDLARLRNFRNTSWLTDNWLKIIIAGVVCLIILAVVIYFVTWSVQHENKRLKKAKDECQKYVNFACQHPLQENSHLAQIKGGENVTLGQLPHVAFLKMNAGGIESVCTGSLISEYYILSAAHCVHQLGNKLTIRVKLGSLTSNLTDGMGEVFEVTKYHIHKGFIDYARKVNDVVLLRLAKKVEFSSTIRPICLNTEYTPQKYAYLSASGWGYTEAGKLSEYLKTVRLFITESGISMKCQVSKVGNFDDNKMICAGHPSKWDSPQRGDSGGPLQIPLENNCSDQYVYEQIGVTSSVENRAATPDETLLSLFTRVDEYVPWIVDIVWQVEN